MQTRSKTNEMNANTVRKVEMVASSTLIKRAKKPKGGVGSRKKLRKLNDPKLSFGKDSLPLATSATKSMKGQLTHPLDSRIPGSSQYYPPTPSQIPIESTASSQYFVNLSFDIQQAKDHLIKQEPRFESLFLHFPTCKPFEEGLDHPLNPFRTLCSSIISQQISGHAANSILKRFIEFYRPQDIYHEGILESDAVNSGGITSEPIIDKYNPNVFFPTAELVASTTEEMRASLKSVGLSGQKIIYILDLARHFQDGLLSTKMLVEAKDEDVIEKLCAVKGIGPWTAHMACMFCFRKPDILPYGDLGVQKGICAFFGIPLKKSKLPYLNKKRMEELTEGWKPYRSIGSWYMWKMMELENRIQEEEKSHL